MAAAGPEPRFSAEAVRKFSAANFEHPLWAEHALACVGCGACAHTCPTCHCFDIVDEHSARVRNWDSCQFSLFTLHASGHNPRPDQGSRQRQRILHKFSIYPGQVRRNPLHRLRQLHAELPRRSGRLASVDCD